MNIINLNSNKITKFILFVFIHIPLSLGGQSTENKPVATAVEVNTQSVEEADISTSSIFTEILSGDPIVVICLLVLVFLSIFSWGIFIAKVLYLRKLNSASEEFIKYFWDSRSLNDLNGRLKEYSYSPAKEVFRAGYAELVKSIPLRDSSHTMEIGISAALNNLNRSLLKTKSIEKKQMEKLLYLLAIIASTSPFIGLFGTVWGIMGAFEGIARSGSASLAAVAPGISEALIATAFGLAAAIPAAIGYNYNHNIVKNQLNDLNSFIADFLNIVERYLVVDKKNSDKVK